MNADIPARSCGRRSDPEPQSHYLAPVVCATVTGIVPSCPISPVPGTPLGAVKSSLLGRHPLEQLWCVHGCSQLWIQPAQGQLVSKPRNHFASFFSSKSSLLKMMMLHPQQFQALVRNPGSCGRALPCSGHC